MRHGRYATTCILLLALAAPTTAFADSGSGDTSAGVEPTATKPAEETATKPPVEASTPPVTETKPPVETSTKPPVTTTAPPQTETPSTPVTTTPTPETPAVPETPDLTPDPCIGPDCVPATPKTPESVPDSPGGGRDLPFTGPGDVALAILLAMLAGSAGLLFVAGAAGREQLDALSPTGMDSPSGFQLAYRQLRKDQLRD